MVLSPNDTEARANEPLVVLLLEADPAMDVGRWKCRCAKPEETRLNPPFSAVDFPVSLSSHKKGLKSSLIEGSLAEDV